ncbi:MAG: chemotaxis protein CheB [Paraburkholderia tropica]|uniref:protein-glutamate methylesterase n=1 Tax=Paraburkholderia tropica TaxID=92647 RepID=A0AAQ1GCT5_9BURK|nr:chemotaxis protein CheB [Paraburkholderia tropica]MDE1144464.1 chemotaxis protein CheB [Paraburkholderia tropica]PXX17355.1 CheB methylesterase [Paraburkholderia tropica]PZW84536.1 CheB methylesterase [Paraburkholderia tropica]RQN39665.1 chemotaxis protein CheB [Paraburkholderia tropica]SEJ21697.1 CheB methylesterase [Paraburkholderia tropica]
MPGSRAKSALLAAASAALRATRGGKARSGQTAQASSAASTHASPPASSDAKFDAVVIGASAGGVDVLGQLLPMLPARFGAAVLIVLHLPPASPSFLVQALGVRCALPVSEPDAGEPIQGGRVYIAPPDYHMLVDSDASVALSIEGPVRFSRPSIDVLMESAAAVYGARLLGVLLSGANDDGARGLAAIRAAGGTTWAQAPDTAYAPQMPEAAIAAGAVNETLTPTALGARLAAWPRLLPASPG